MDKGIEDLRRKRNCPKSTQKLQRQTWGWALCGPRSRRRELGALLGFTGFLFLMHLPRASVCPSEGIGREQSSSYLFCFLLCLEGKQNRAERVSVLSKPSTKEKTAAPRSERRMHMSVCAPDLSAGVPHNGSQVSKVQMAQLPTD